MVELEGDILRQVQLTELEMLVEVDRICRKCGINYSIWGGTLLGAARHKGFIPWDDDADVAFLREDYEKFRKALKTELDTSRFYFQDQRRTRGYRWTYGKLRRKGTEFVRVYQEHMPYRQGIFIDLFAMDYMPDNYGLRTVHNFVNFCYRKFFWSEVGKVADKSPLKRAVYRRMDRVPEMALKRSYWHFVSVAGKKKTDWARNYGDPPLNREWGYKVRWMKNLAEIEFEGVKLMGLADYDEYLTFTYGDYMTLPPVGKRKSHPVSKLRLLSGQTKRG